MRTHAKFCSDHCRYTANNKRRNAPRWLQQFEDLLMQHAPGSATGYRLALIRGRVLWWYPPATRESVRADAPPRIDSQFSLVPFERPIVPTTDLYGVRFFDSLGRRLRTPAALLAGVEARRLRRIKIEDGDHE